MADHNNTVQKSHTLVGRLKQYMEDNMGLIAIGMLSMNGNYTRQSFIYHCNRNEK
jgi:hypothetical protein